MFQTEKRGVKAGAQIDHLIWTIHVFQEMPRRKVHKFGSNVITSNFRNYKTKIIK